MTMFSRTAARLLCGAVGLVAVGFVPAAVSAQSLVAKDAEPGSPAPVAAPEPADQAVAAGAVHGHGRKPRRAASEAAVPGPPAADGAPHAAQQQGQQLDS